MSIEEVEASDGSGSESASDHRDDASEDGRDGAEEVPPTLTLLDD